MGRWVLLAAAVLVVSAVAALHVHSVRADPGPVTGEMDAVAVEVDVSPDPLRQDHLATLHVRVRNTETTNLRRVDVRPFWPDGTRFEGVEFGQSGWQLRCPDDCHRDPLFVVWLAPGDSATANVTLRVPGGSGPTSLLGLRATEDRRNRMLLAKEVAFESGPDGGRDGWLPDLSVLESLAVIAAALVAVATFVLRLRSGT